MSGHRGRDRRRRGERRALLALLISAALAGCQEREGASATAGPSSVEASTSDTNRVGEGASSLPVLADVADRPAWPAPQGAPARFDFGTGATPERIARWDRDVRPDGEGLPPGSGSAAEGGLVWASKCIACHGPTGTEGPNDRLVGRDPREGFPFGADRAAGPRTVGNYWPYATTLFDYITRAMPQDAPGSLSSEETYAVIAWILSRNEIVDEGAVLDAATLAAVRMPAAGRFVPDDRRGGPEVR